MQTFEPVPLGNDALRSDDLHQRNVASRTLAGKFFGTRGDELRRHVRAVTMDGSEKPMPVVVETTNRRHSVQLVREGSNKLRQKRRYSSQPGYSTTKDTFNNKAWGSSTDAIPHFGAMGPVITVNPILQSPLETIMETPLTAEQYGDQKDYIPRKTGSWSSQPQMANPTYTLYSSQPRSGDAVKTANLPFSKLSRPRKLSGMSAGSAAPLGADEGTVLGSRRPSWESFASLDQFESNNWRPSYTYKPSSSQTAFAKPRPTLQELFEALPSEVLRLVLDKLRELHLSEASGSCATCWMRDVCSVCLSSRKWAEVARVALYEDIELVGADSAAHKKKFKQSQGSRLVLLRRTFRSNQDIAEITRFLKVPRFEASTSGSSSKGQLTGEQYEDLAASLIMACPKLERFSGLMPRYDHTYKRIFHALSTRAKLAQMHWLVDASAGEKQKVSKQGSPKGSPIVPGPLSQVEQDAFLSHFRNWSSLTSLSIHCLPGATLAPRATFTQMIKALPSLQHLHLCNLPQSAFNDSNLLSLPRLRTLTLSHLSGITSNGLSAFATHANSGCLQKLHLRHAPITSLPALARIFSNLRSLSNFSLVQAYPPTMPEADSFTLWMMPYLASASVVKLHWDITSIHSTGANSADDILARSIAASGFPQLQTLRTPNDAQGMFQALCRPVERIDLPTDRFRKFEQPAVGQPSKTGPKQSQKGKGTPSSPTTPTSPTSPSSLSIRAPSCTDLCAARLAAQARLENARLKPQFLVNVVDEDGTLVDRFGLAGHIGKQGSMIDYYLHPDVGSSDEKGGLVDVRDLDSDMGETLATDDDGCNGSWNRPEDGSVADKKEREKWWHTERGTWSRIELD